MTAPSSGDSFHYRRTTATLGIAQPPLEQRTRILNKRSVYSWALYDWANSAFATTVVAGFFPVFFKQYWCAGADVAASTFRLGAANSLASVVVALIAPILGSIADRGSRKRRFLSYSMIMGVVMTAALYFAGQGAWQIAIAIYVAANIGFAASNIFYDALIVSVTDDAHSDSVSALGYALGYLGGGLLFAVNVAMTRNPGFFGLHDAGQAVRVSFVMVAVWWALFSVPILIFVKETGGENIRGWAALTAGWQQLRGTLVEIRELRTVFVFLIAYFLYIDGVQTIARMAVDYGLSLGLKSESLIIALLITQFIGFPAAIAFGKIGERLGAKTGIYIGIAVYAVVCIYSVFMRSEREFYILAITVGLVQGGIQSLSRSLYSRIIPKTKAAEFFGFYNMLGKFSTVLGPILMGWIGVLTGNPRLTILSVIVLFIAGAVMLVKVSEAAGIQAARGLERTSN